VGKTKRQREDDLEKSLTGCFIHKLGGTGFRPFFHRNAVLLLCCFVALSFYGIVAFVPKRYKKPRSISALFFTTRTPLFSFFCAPCTFFFFLGSLLAKKKMHRLKRLISLLYLW
jgi:hypothetical protein